MTTFTRFLFIFSIKMTNFLIFNEIILKTKYLLIETPLNAIWQSIAPFWTQISQPCLLIWVKKSCTGSNRSQDSTFLIQTLGCSLTINFFTWKLYRSVQDMYMKCTGQEMKHRQIVNFFSLKMRKLEILHFYFQKTVSVIWCHYINIFFSLYLRNNSNGIEIIFSCF